MFSRWLIRYQMYFGLAMLLFIVTLLSVSAFQGVFKFRKLTKSLRTRATELPLAATLNQAVGDLRVTLSQISHSRSELGLHTSSMDDPLTVREKFKMDLASVHQSLEAYRKQVLSARPSDPRIADTTPEEEMLAEIDRRLAIVDRHTRENDWVFSSPGDSSGLMYELEQLQVLTSELPALMKQRMDSFAETARTEYHAWMWFSGVVTLFAITLLIFLVHRFNKWIFVPLKVLLAGSRRVACGDFTHHIQLGTQDELAELAAAMNAMTRRFREIRDDLDRQVQLRTKEVVRGEQLASVGFLAAGVAHEINNPLASIAWAAESLESRLLELIKDYELDEDEESLAECEILTKYLRKIQDEAFRCKGITDNLLDFSRMGDVERESTDLRALTEGVIEMVRHLGKYREKQIHFHAETSVVAAVNPQEIKQVVLNLITNALDSLEVGGHVDVHLSSVAGNALLEVTDNGCGMTDEVKQHLFEPFFTRRRDGSGTGLGLSITYQIVADHGGNIEVESAGPGCGSTLRVHLPLVKHAKKKQRQDVAA